MIYNELMAFNLGDIFVTFKGRAEGFQGVVNTIKNAGDHVQSLSEKVSHAGEKMTNVGKKMTVGLTVPIVGFGVAAFKSAATFEQTMKQIEVATGAGGKSMSELSALAEEMGAKTKFSANEAAEAMLELAKGGITEAQIRAGALDATMTLAAAGGIELASAAGFVSNALNTFGLQAEDANAVAAALAGGANASTASIESLGLALSQVGPGARLAGYSLQETVAALAAFDNAGVKGSDAGTSLKTMLMGLNPSTKEAADLMKKLGLNFTNAEGKFIPLRDVAEQLKTKLSGLSDAQKQTTLQTIFGTDAYRAAAILMTEGSAGIDKYTAATSDLGAAQEMAAAMTSGSAGKIEMMMGSLETAMKKVGDVIAPTVIKIAEKVGVLAEKFSNLDPKLQTMIITGLALIAVLGPMFIILGQIAMGISAIGTAFAFLLANPVVLAVVAVILLIAGLAFLIVHNWETLKNFFMGLFGWFMANWPMILAILTGPFGIALLMIKRNWETIAGFFGSVLNGVKGVFADVAGAIVGPWRAAFNAIARLWNAGVGTLSFKAPDWVPGMGGKGWTLPKMPVLDTGGIISGPTIAALAVNNRPEAVIPLDKIADVAADINMKSGGGDTYNIHLSGVAARSQADLRKIGMDIVEAVEQKKRASTGFRTAKAGA